MTHEDAGKYSQKHPADRKVDENLKKMVLEKSSDGTIRCNVAHDIAAAAGCAPEEVGFVIDRLELRLTHCTLGLFGYPGEKPVMTAPEKSDKAIVDALDKAVKENPVPEGKKQFITCKQAWDIADQLKVGRLTVSRETEHRGYKIKACQLGAF